MPESSATLLVLGDERREISTRLQELCTTNIRLPMIGRADSLNVAVAAAVTPYELVRRTT
jgi:tRNA G18 (ribose-2'-O)-methylase SpoU